MTRLGKVGLIILAGLILVATIMFWPGSVVVSQPEVPTDKNFQPPGYLTEVKGKQVPKVIAVYQKVATKATSSAAHALLINHLRYLQSRLPEFQLESRDDASTKISAIIHQCSTAHILLAQKAKAEGIQDEGSKNLSQVSVILFVAAKEGWNLDRVAAMQ